MRFIPRGVGCAADAEGYAAAFDAIEPAAAELAARGWMRSWSSGHLAFYRGPEAPTVCSNGCAPRPGFRSAPWPSHPRATCRRQRQRVAIATAYTDVVNRRLKELLAAAGSRRSLECFDILEFGGPGKKSEADIIS
jgi:hypothetical protein